MRSASAGPSSCRSDCDRTSGTLAGVTVFDERPDDAVFAKLSEEFRNSLGASIAPKPPESTVFEIVAEA
jgi:hypothetical protein